MVYIASRTLVEQIAFTKNHVTSLDWVTYPIMRFKDSPQGHPDRRPTNRPSTTRRRRARQHGRDSAIANAFFDATGVRMRDAPMTPARVRAVLKAAGVA